jgi:hypothetical protein
VTESREHDPSPEVPPFADVTLRTPPNWTAVCFAGMLGIVHLSVAVPSLLAGRWACHLSLIIGTICVVACLVGYHCRSEMAVLTSQHRVRLRTGVGRFCFERFIPFSGVRAVRIMAEQGVRAAHPEATIELLCRGEDVLCPPTRIPRQQALFMAMALNVPLIKVSEEAPAAPDRMTENPVFSDRGND